MSWLPQMLKEIREEAGLSSSRASIGSGIHYQTLRGWETGAASPRVEALERLLKFYGYEVDILKVESRDDRELGPDPLGDGCSATDLSGLVL